MLKHEQKIETIWLASNRNNKTKDLDNELWAGMHFAKKLM